MAKVKMENNDGETSGLNKPVVAKEVETFNVRLDAFGKKKDSNPEECPEGYVPMVCGKNTRVACLSGNIYNLAAGKVEFIQKRDQNVCAGKGAVLQDAAAIAIRKQAEADAVELAEHRAEKAKRKAEKEASPKSK